MAADTLHYYRKKHCEFFFMLNLKTILDWAHAKASSRNVKLKTLLKSGHIIKCDKNNHKVSDMDGVNLTSYWHHELNKEHTH